MRFSMNDEKARVCHGKRMNFGKMIVKFETRSFYWKQCSKNNGNTNANTRQMATVCPVIEEQNVSQQPKQPKNETKHVSKLNIYGRKW